HPVRCERGAIGDSRVPFRDWIALPRPRGDDRAGPPTNPVSRAADLPAPAGVVVLDGDPGEAAVPALARVTMFAGPILSRMGMASAVRQAADRATKERDRLTSIIDSLPDPIVITNAANDIIVQNARAERLLNTRESDSEG